MNCAAVCQNVGDSRSLLTLNHPSSEQTGCSADTSRNRKRKRKKLGGTVPASGVSTPTLHPETCDARHIETNSDENDSDKEDSSECLAVEATPLKVGQGEPEVTQPSSKAALRPPSYRPAPTCDICGGNPSRYSFKCCRWRCCSLECYRQHTTRSSSPSAQEASLDSQNSVALDRKVRASHEPSTFNATESAFSPPAPSCTTEKESSQVSTDDDRKSLLAPFSNSVLPFPPHLVAPCGGPKRFDECRALQRLPHRSVTDESGLDSGETVLSTEQKLAIRSNSKILRWCDSLTLRRIVRRIDRCPRRLVTFANHMADGEFQHFVDDLVAVLTAAPGAEPEFNNPYADLEKSLGEVAEFERSGGSEQSI